MDAAQIAFVIAYGLLGAAQLALLIAAFDTSAKLGVMAFFLPMYVASFGNHRLRTDHRRTLAIAWWTALAALVGAVIVFG